MNEKEKKAIIYFDDILTNKCDIEFWKRIKNLTNKQQKEIEEKTTIIMAGAKKVKQLEKEIEEKDKYIKAIADIRIQDSKENYSDVIDKYFISKDKIKDKIKTLEKELLEEN